MNNKPTAENLRKFVEQISECHQSSMTWIASPSSWIFELQNHPERFRRNNEDELIWLGYKVITTMPRSNDEICLWLMADKIIPKENNNV